MGVAVRFTKWGSRPHWEFTVERLDADEWGLWLGGRAGTEARRGEASWIVPYDFVMLVPAEGCWIASWNTESPGREVDVYVDVTTRPTVTGDTVHAVDLDLDVVRLHGGQVELVDEDEFAEHRVQLGYPPDVIELAQTTAVDLVDAVTRRAEPFGKVGAAKLAAFATG